MARELSGRRYPSHRGGWRVQGAGREMTGHTRRSASWGRAIPSVRGSAQSIPRLRLKSRAGSLQSSRPTARSERRKSRRRRHVEAGALHIVWKTMQRRRSALQPCKRRLPRVRAPSSRRGACGQRPSPHPPRHRALHHLISTALDDRSMRARMCTTGGVALFLCAKGRRGGANVLL